MLMGLFQDHIVHVSMPHSVDTLTLKAMKHGTHWPTQASNKTAKQKSPSANGVG